MQTDDFEDDFALSEGPGYKAALCAKCKQIKPLAEFERLMSKAYGQSRGRVGNVRMRVESSMCRACRPKPRSAGELSRKELHNRVVAGDMHPMIVDAMLKERKERGRARSRTAVQAAWDAKRMEYWQPIIDRAKHERRRVQQQEKHAKHTLGMDDEALTFFVEYKALLTVTVARLSHMQKTLASKKSEGIPPHALWQGFVDPSDWQKVRALWLAMPFTYRTVAKAPALLDIHPQDVEPFKPENKTLRRGPSPAERLGTATAPTTHPPHPTNETH